MLKKASRYLLLILVVLASIYFLFLVKEVLLTFLLGAILAYLLFRPVLLIEKRGLKRVWAILILYAISSVLLILLFYIAIPGFVKELMEIADIVAENAEKTERILSSVNHIEMPQKISIILQENIAKIENTIYNSLQNFVGGFYVLLNTILAVIFSPILAFYIMNDWEMIRDKFLMVLSPAAKRETIAVFKQIDEVLIEFFKGHFIVALFVGVMVGVAAAVLGVRFPLILGILSGITNLIPYFGPFLGGIPAVLVALADSVKLAIYMGIAIIIIQQIEGGIITPKIIGNRLGMHPLMVVFSLLAGGKLLGIWGMLIAVPLTAIIKVIIARVYLRIVE